MFSFQKKKKKNGALENGVRIEDFVLGAIFDCYGSKGRTRPKAQMSRTTTNNYAIEVT